MTGLSSWPALVLTAGLATRLAPLSNVRAKAALPVAGVPLIGRILLWLRAAGVRRAVLNLHHRAETITRVVGDGSQWDVEVRYSWEPEVLGSAGGPSRALPLLDADRFLIINGDTLTDCALADLVARHTDVRPLVTMALVPGDVARYGGVIVGADDRVLGFQSRRTPAAPVHRTAPGAPVAPVLHFIGVQAVESRAFDGVSDDRPSETIRTLYPQLLARQGNAIAAFRSNAAFFDVGTPRDYFTTVARVARTEGVPFDRGEHVQVAPDAEVSETILWDHVTIQAGARLHRCVVADGVFVKSGRYEEQVLVATPEGTTNVTPLTPTIST